MKSMGSQRGKASRCLVSFGVKDIHGALIKIASITVNGIIGSSFHTFNCVLKTNPVGNPVVKVKELARRN